MGHQASKNGKDSEAGTTKVEELTDESQNKEKKDPTMLFTTRRSSKVCVSENNNEPEPPDLPSVTSENQDENKQENEESKKKKKPKKLREKAARLFSSRANKMKIVPADTDTTDNEGAPSPLSNGSAVSVTFVRSSKTGDGSDTESACEAEELEDGFITPSQLYNHMNDGQLNQYLKDPMFMLIIDARPLADYTRQHITTAMHYTNVESSSDIENIEKYTFIILYDDRGLTHSLTDSVISQILDRLHQMDADPPLILHGGYEKFSQTYPFLCTDKMVSSEFEREKWLTWYPSVILEKKLYQGRIDQATNSNIIQDLRITHIVNITQDQSCPFKDATEYLCLPLDDMHTSNLLKHFNEATTFIHDAITGGGRVLVHCNMGISRSSTVTTAYLMKTKQWTVETAFKFTRERRRVSQPNRGFFKQLSKFEEQIFGKKITDVNALWR